MKNRLKVLPLSLMLVLVPLARIVSAQPQAGDAEKAAKVKSDIAKRLADKKTNVKIKLRNGEEVKGRIDQADDNLFTVTQDKTAKKVEIAYSEVAAVKGRGLSTAAKIGIIAAIAVGVLAIAVVVALRNFDPFSGGITAR